MSIYPRTCARIDNRVKLNRNFYDNGAFYDPYTIDKIEIWATRYDPEFETQYPGVLKKDIIYGSRIAFLNISGSILNTIGFEPGADATESIYVSEFEYPFSSEDDITIIHGLNDRYPVVTVYQSNGQIIMPDIVTSIDSNTIRVQFAVPVSGVVDILGATDNAQTGTLYTSLARRFIQPFSVTTAVTVVHNLNDDNPLVNVWDSNYRQIIGSVIQVIDANSLVVTFSSTQSGEIIVMGGVQGNTASGFGSQAVIYGTASQTYCIHTGENDKLLVKVGLSGTDQEITLTQKFAATVSDIVSDINSQLTGAKAYISDQDSNKIMIKSIAYGLNSSIQLKPITNSAYNILGLPVVQARGLGKECAYAIGSKTGTFPLTTASYQMLLNFDSMGWWTIDLPKVPSSAQAIVSAINDFFNLKYGTSGVFYAEVTVDRRVQLNAIGGSVEIAVCPNEAYAEIGFSVGTYTVNQISTNAEYFVINSTNRYMRFVVNYAYPIIDVTVTTGNRTAQQIADDINAAITNLGLTEVVDCYVTEGVLGGRIKIEVLVNDGIIREGVGQYYALYKVPITFTESGVLWKKYLDVWNYVPVMNYNSSIYDDTDYFIVYPYNYFLDSGYNNYSFDFTLVNDTFMKGEKKYIQVDITALPKYKTPTITEWLLPIVTGEYRVTTLSDLEIVAWTDVSTNTGKSLKVLLDTNDSIWRDGAYKIYFRLALPEGSVIISQSNKFRIINK